MEMNYNNNEKEMWNWQGQDYCPDDDTSIVNQNGEHISYIYDGTTPLKACGDLAYHASVTEVICKDMEQYNEPSSQVKRRRMLQFESDVLDTPLCNDEAVLRSKETNDSLENSISEMPEWIAGFTEGTSLFSNECLDPSSEGWIAECFNDAEMHFTSDDISSESGALDVQIDITELCNTRPEYKSNVFKSDIVQTRQNVVFRGKRSYMRPPPKASSVVKPFDIIKPCGVHGHVTLKDINQKICNPRPKPKQIEDPCISYPTSAITGKPVVGKTKIPTQGGKGSITIMRTKG